MYYTYPLKAQTFQGIPYEFKVSDLPGMLDSKTIILTGKTNSPMLDANTLHRGFIIDNKNFYEGDLFYDKHGFEYIIVYRKGFMAVSKDSDIKLLPNEFKQYKIIKSINTSATKIKNITYKVFGYKDAFVSIKSFLGKVDKKSVAVANKLKVVNVNILQQAAGVTNSDNKQLFFGDKVDGFKLILYCGRISIMINNRIIDLYPITTRKEEKNGITII